MVAIRDIAFGNFAVDPTPTPTASAPSNPNVVYAGTGEGNPRNNASFGDGVYKSIDGGDHWTRMGLEKTDRIAQVQIKLSWYSDSGGKLRETQAMQTWERHGKTWLVIEETRLKGTEMPGLREPPTAE